MLMFSLQTSNTNSATAVIERMQATTVQTEEVLQAQAEELTLRVANNATGYLCVYLTKPGQLKPYLAQMKSGGKSVYLGYFATADEAALCVARSSEGQAAAQKAAAASAAAAPVPLTSEEARQQALTEGLVLRVADNGAGYFGVCHKPGKVKPYQARVSRGGKHVYLGRFANAEEAALCVARTPEGQAAAKRAAAAPPPSPPLTSEEARQKAQAEGLTLRVAENTTGYFGVYLDDRPSPTSRGFATAEEAALCVARSPKEQAAAKREAAAPVPLTSEEARQQAQAEELTLLVADTKTGYSGVTHHPGRTKPYLVRVSRGGKQAYLGHFATAEEAALCVARSPEGRAAAEKVAAAPPLTRKEAQHQARDTIIRAVALDIIYEAARAATAELSAEVAAEVMAGIAMGL
eukprot:scaffold4271_cov57-Phaeocystis_antarctica.AAC.3